MHQFQFVLQAALIFFLLHANAAGAKIVLAKDKANIGMLTAYLRGELAKNVEREKKTDEEIEFEIQNALKLYDLIEASEEPALFERMPAVLALLEKLDQLDADPTEITYIALVNDMRANAFFAKLENGQKVIFINKGLFLLTANDHELAFIAGHEMEHAHAKTSKSAESQFGKKASRAFQRSEENEVDLRAVYHRMMGAGFNPYAAEDCMQKLIDANGDGFSFSHTSGSSRRDTLSAFIAVLRRQQGKSIVRQEAYDDTALKPLKEYLSSGAHRERQRRALITYVDSFEAHPEKLYQALSESKPFPRGFMPSDDIERAESNIHRLGSQMFSLLELDQFLIRLHLRLDRLYEEARVKYMSTNPEVLGVPWVNRYRDLQARRFGTLLPDLWDVLRSMDINAKKISELEKKRDAAAGDTRDKLESELLHEKSKTSKLEARRTLALQAYEPIPEQTMRKLEALSIGSFAELMSFVQSHLLPLRKGGLGDLYLRRLEAMRGISHDQKEVLIDAMARDNSVHTDESIEKLYGLDPELRRNLQWEAFKHFLKFREDVSANYAESGKIADVESYFFANSWIILPGNSIRTAFEKNPDEAYQLWVRHIDTMLQFDFSVPVKARILNEMVFSGNLHSIPEAARKEMRAHFETTRQKLSAAGFLKEIGSIDALEIGKRMNSFVEREKLPNIPGWLVEAGVDQFEQSLRKEGLLIHDYDLLFLLRSPGLWQKMPAKERPDLSRLWSYLLGLPRERMIGKSGRALRLDFDHLIELFSKHVGEYELFSRLIELRHRLEFGNDMSESQSLARSRFFEFARRHRPADAELFTVITTPHYKERDHLRIARETLLAEAVRSSLEENRNEPTREQAYQAGLAVIAQFEKTWGKEEVLAIIRNLHKEFLPDNKFERMEVILVFKQWSGTFGEYTRGGELSTAALFKTDEDFVGYRLEQLFEYWKTTAHAHWPEGENDRVFNYIWRNASQSSGFLKDFTFPELVSKLVYDDEKEKLAVWQINWLLSQSHPGPQKDGVRAIVKKTAKFIETQLTTASALRNRILDIAEKKLVTNASETAEFKKLRQTADDPKAAGSLLLVDSVHHLSKLAKSNFDKQEMIEFLVGKDRPAPSCLTPDQAYSLKRVFMNSSESVRAFAFQALLDQNTGVLSEVSVKARLDRFMLGDGSDQPVLRRLFDAYLESVAPSERVVLIAHALASMAGQGGRQISVRSMLELMGPLGIKAGQFLKTTGLVGPEIRKDLDGFLDRAMAAARYEIFARLSEIFGEGLSNIELVGELIGSGSINYVVKAQINGRIVAIRLLREEASGQVANEDGIWRRVIASLLSSDNQDFRQWGGILEEARAHSMRTLSKGGAEFDLELERKNYEMAAAIYSSAADSASGFRVETMKPDFELQSLVPTSFTSSVTIMEFVNATSLRQVEVNLRQQLANQIVAAELRAMFELGTFDPDGHPGNWLADIQAKRLVRIDYAQIYKIEASKRELIRKVLKLMVQPTFSATDLNVLGQILPRLFVGLEKSDEWAVHLNSILRARTFPSYRQPQERLMHLREALEQLLGTGHTIRFDSDLRTVISALGRIAGFREFMRTPSEFDRILLSALGTSRTDLALTTVRNGWERLGETCARLLRSK